jgi:ABC-type transport system substrate-binding protein
MESFIKLVLRPWQILVLLLALILLLAVGCGSATAPAATAPAATAPAASAAPAPDKGTAPMPDKSEPSAPAAAAPIAPTSAPMTMPEPAEAMVEIHPGKLTIMVGDLANERFDQVFQFGLPGELNYGRLVHGFLASASEDKELMPGIAENWSLSPDGLTWTFTIHQGLKFQDGSDITTEDILWTLQHNWGPHAVEYTTSPTVSRISRGMDRVEQTGPNKVSLIFQRPDPEFVIQVSEASTSWYGVLPKRDKLHDEEVEVAYDANPIGAGIMKLVDHTRSYSMGFERFDDHYYQPGNGFPEDRRVNFAFLDMFVVPEESTRVAALRAGEADIVPASLQAKGQIESGDGRLVFGQEGVYVRTRLYGCWLPEFPCHDKRVRQAINYAIDKELIRDRLYDGPDVFQVKGFAFVTPSTIGYTPELDPWPQDGDKARQLLADAGYPNGEGFGTFVVNTYPSSAMPFQVEAAQIAADMLRQELGLDVEVRITDSVGMKKARNGGELYGQLVWRDNETRISAVSSTVSGYGDLESLSRVSEDPEVRTLVNKTATILDTEERIEGTKSLLVRLRDESYEIGIGYVNIPWGVGPRVLTWKPYSLSPQPSALHTITLK